MTMKQTHSCVKISSRSVSFVDRNTELKSSFYHDTLPVGTITVQEPDLNAGCVSAVLIGSHSFTVTQVNEKQ